MTMKQLMPLLLTTLIVSCSPVAEPVKHFSMPSNATGVKVFSGDRGELKQLLYVTSNTKGHLNNIRHMDQELRSAAFSRCDSGEDSWFRVRGDSKSVDRKRLVRFYKTTDKDTLAMLSIDESCGLGSTECKQLTVVVFTTYPWWIINRSNLIDKTCGLP